MPHHPSTPSPAPSLTTPLITALALAAASCAAHALLPPAYARVFSAVLLGALGGVYLGGALRAGSHAEVAVTAFAAVLCIAIASAGLIGPAWLIPVGFLLHGLWDWVHHVLERRTVGRWWPPFCALYDLIVGVYLLLPHQR